MARAGGHAWCVDTRIAPAYPESRPISKATQGCTTDFSEHLLATSGLISKRGMSPPACACARSVGRRQLSTFGAALRDAAGARPLDALWTRSRARDPDGRAETADGAGGSAEAVALRQHVASPLFDVVPNTYTTHRCDVCGRQANECDLCSQGYRVVNAFRELDHEHIPRVDWAQVEQDWALVASTRPQGAAPRPPFPAPAPPSPSDRA